jgi:hypothetical protein
MTVSQTYVDPEDAAEAKRARGRGLSLGLRQGVPVEQYLAHVEELREAHGHTVRVLGDVGKLLDRMTPKIIEVRTIVLDANGCAHNGYHVPYKALCIDSGSAKLLTVANMTLQSEAPGQGPGIVFVRIGGTRVVNLAGYSWSIYGGNAGELVTVTAFANTQPEYAR